jgi:hypothetical protein
MNNQIDLFSVPTGSAQCVLKYIKHKKFYDSYTQQYRQLETLTEFISSNTNNLDSVLELQLLHRVMEMTPNVDKIDIMYDEYLKYLQACDYIFISIIDPSIKTWYS